MIPTLHVLLSPQHSSTLLLHSLHTVVFILRNYLFLDTLCYFHIKQAVVSKFIHYLETRIVNTSWKLQLWLLAGKSNCGYCMATIIVATFCVKEQSTCRHTSFLAMSSLPRSMEHNSKSLYLATSQHPSGLNWWKHLIVE